MASSSGASRNEGGVSSRRSPTSCARRSRPSGRAPTSCASGCPARSPTAAAARRDHRSRLGPPARARQPDPGGSLDSAQASCRSTGRGSARHVVRAPWTSCGRALTRRASSSSASSPARSSCAWATRTGCCQVIVNLVANSIRFTPRGGRVGRRLIATMPSSRSGRGHRRRDSGQRAGPHLRGLPAGAQRPWGDRTRARHRACVAQAHGGRVTVESQRARGAASPCSCRAHMRVWLVALTMLLAAASPGLRALGHDAREGRRLAGEATTVRDGRV